MSQLRVYVAHSSLFYSVRYRIASAFASRSRMEMVTKNTPCFPIQWREPRRTSPPLQKIHSQNCQRHWSSTSRIAHRLVKQMLKDNTIQECEEKMDAIADRTELNPESLVQTIKYFLGGANESSDDCITWLSLQCVEATLLIGTQHY